MARILLPLFHEVAVAMAVQYRWRASGRAGGGNQETDLF